MRTIEFFGRNELGETVSEGTLTLKDGQLVASPAGALRSVLASDVWIYRDDPQPQLILRATHDPAAFLAALPAQYGHGSRFWCKVIES